MLNEIYATNILTRAMLLMFEDVLFRAFALGGSYAIVLSKSY